MVSRADLLELMGRRAPPPVVAGAESPALEAPAKSPVANLPNLLSMLGYAAALVYLQGGSPAFAIASIVADELDGRLARATGQTSPLGSDLDWGIDVTLTGLYADRLGILWTLPLITGGQAYMRSHGERPSVLSARAVLMIVALWRTRFGRLPKQMPAITQLRRDAS